MIGSPRTRNKDEDLVSKDLDKDEDRESPRTRGKDEDLVSNDEDKDED